MIGHAALLDGFLQDASAATTYPILNFTLIPRPVLCSNAHSNERHFRKLPAFPALFAVVLTLVL